MALKGKSESLNLKRSKPILIKIPGFSEHKELIFISPAFFNQNYFLPEFCRRHFDKGKDKVSGLRLLWGAIAETADALEVSLGEERSPEGW